MNDLLYSSRCVRKIIVSPLRITKARNGCPAHLRATLDKYAKEHATIACSQFEEAIAKLPNVTAIEFLNNDIIGQKEIKEVFGGPIDYADVDTTGDLVMPIILRAMLHKGANIKSLTLNSLGEWFTNSGRDDAERAWPYRAVACRGYVSTCSRETCVPV